MGLLDLPLEIFRKILIEAVLLRGIKRAVRLGLVNKLFQEELIEALCVSKLTNECYVKVKKWQLVTPCVERRLRERQTEAFPLLNTIRKIAELLAAEAGANSSYETYALQILQLASTNRYQLVRHLLEKSERRWLTFHDDFLTAAAFTGNAALVETLAEKELRMHFGLLGNQFQATVRTSNCHILGMLLARLDFSELMLYDAIKCGNLKIIKFLLEPKCYGSNPWVNISHIRKEKNGRVGMKYGGLLLSTPDIEIFEIILSELQSRDMITTWDENFLRHLLSHAVDSDWIPMLKHLIRLGAPLDKSNLKRAVDPLQQACIKGNDEVVQVLLENGAKPSCSALKSAIKHGHTPIVETLLGVNGFLHASCANRYLYAAAKKGFMDIVQLLLDVGMDPNGGYEQPLIGAVESEHTAMFHMLIERGAIVSRVLPEATRRAEDAGLESMLVLLNEYLLSEEVGDSMIVGVV